MFKNYLKIAVRSFLSQRYYSLINVLGLALGTSSCILILLFIQDELSFEKGFKNNQLIYRLVEDFPMGEHLSQSATVPFPTKNTLLTDFPEITNAALIFRPSSWGNAPIIKVKDQSYIEDNLVFAEHGFLEIYNFTFLKGESSKALNDPNQIILTASTAKKYFGEEDPIGKTVNLSNFRELAVIGVVEDLPGNTHLHFDMIVSFETFKSFFSNNPTFFETQWVWVAAWMYFTVPDEETAQKISSALPSFVKKHYPTALSDKGLALRLQKVNDVHLNSSLELEWKQNGNIRHVYLFSFIALLIIIIAVINFMNLATSRSVRRAKEVGLRKVMGAHRQMLIRQFLGEAMLTSFFSLLVAVGIMYFALPWFNQLTGKEITLGILFSPQILGGILLLTVFVGLLSGSYPALVLSSFVPTEVLKGKSGSISSSDILRKVLVTTQFVISITLLICIGIVYNQIRFLHNKDLGFDKSQIVMIEMANAFNKYPSIKAELLKNHEVKSVALIGGSVPGQQEIFENAFAPAGTPVENQQFFSAMFANHDFEQVLDLEFIQGHSFQIGSSTDSVGFIINESAAIALGWGKDVVGRSLDQIGNGAVQQTGTVIGLVKDFHYRPLYEAIKPLVIRLGGNVLSVKVQSGDLPATVTKIEEVWSQQVEDAPFRYSFMDTNFDNLYRKEDTFSKTIQYFCMLAIFIACLGLLGLSAYTTESRRKEIGIRKVNGATTFGLVTLLTKDFSMLVFVAFVISVPVAWFFSNLWLDNFAYKTEINIFIFIAAGLISLLLAILTVSYHTFRAARSNPINSLRYE